MGITDELREYTSTRISPNKGMLTAIADRIDAEYEEAIQQAMMGEGGVPATDENMAEHGWVRGPLDADGKMWRSGDMSDSNWGAIEGIAFEDGRWLISGHDISAPWIPADSIRHYQPDTWERIIEDALDADVDDFTCMRDALVARCKALAGDTE